MGLQFVSLAATCQLGCNMSEQLQLSSSAQLQTVSLAAAVPTKCAFSAQLHTFRTAANSKLCIQIYQSSCVLSAHWQFVWSLVLCHTMLLSSILLFLQSVWETALLGPLSLGLLSTHPYNVHIRVYTVVDTLYKPNWAVIYANSDRIQKAYTAAVGKRED